MTLPGAARSNVSLVLFGAAFPDSCSTSDVRRWTRAIAASGALTTAAMILVVLDPTALCALPALVLAVLLALRRYPGERMLALLRDESQEGRQRPPESVSFAGREPGVPRGGLLLACALAVRPPPRRSRAASLSPA
jgi:hypothetical protein